ncbi:MAG: hypothetical protein ACOZIN_13000 [Myxococcota bacterium]
MLAIASFVPLVLATPFAPVYVDRLTAPGGEVTFAAGSLSDPLPGDLRVASRAYALARRAELGLPATSTLGDAEAFGTRFGASFHLPQQVDGIDIFEARVVVTIDKERRVRQLASSAVRYTRAVLVWHLTPGQAVAKAAGVVPWPVLTADGTAQGRSRRQLFRVNDELHAGYYVSIPSVDPTANWLVAVSAVTGEVLFARNQVFHADDADVYPHSPGGLDAGVGVTPVTRVLLRHADGGSMVGPGVATLPNDAGLLSGTQIDAFNCCPNLGCDTSAPDAGPRIVTGATQFQGINVNYELAVCDRVQRASNDPALHSTGDYVYAPVDSPSGAVTQASASDSDPFAEIHAFYHVNQIYDWVRGLSAAASPLFPGQNIPPFQLRDEKRQPARKLAVWANLTIPDLRTINLADVLLTGTARTRSLTRVDNAAFMARENFAQLPIPGLAMDVDTVMLFQGTRADFAYDAPVVWHELGHAVIHSTAGFSAFVVDERSANHEGGALHEAFADYLAAAFGQRSLIGEYVGPRISDPGGGAQLIQDIGLRNADNTYACPEVLWGEVHQDAQHFTGALWQARTEHFLGTDNGRTFDASVYAALASMTPGTSFAQAAAALTNHVALAFSGDSQARQKMESIFDARGVTNCSKVVDVTGATSPRPYYGIGGRQAAGVTTGIVPGPYQMKLSTPNGAASVRILAPLSSGGFGGGQPPQVQLLAKVGAPITFTRTSTGLSHDADLTADATDNGSTLTAEVPIDAPCGASSEVFFTLGTPSSGGEAFRNLTIAFTPQSSCGTDAGTDAGVADAGVVTLPAVDEGGTSGTGQVPAGCGCGTGADLGLFSLLALLGFLTRRATTPLP